MYLIIFSSVNIFSFEILSAGYLSNIGNEFFFILPKEITCSCRRSTAGPRQYIIKIAINSRAGDPIPKCDRINKLPHRYREL